MITREEIIYSINIFSVTGNLVEAGNIGGGGGVLMADNYNSAL